ncbi:EF-P lysine aminoacylase EpmA [Vreelandella jeotgali]|uniref:EF-P lysine aminoacylase EpmA n=1 Tax=Vreelandella jeotgali TaxID=553386 RepID=UPI0006876851|nr:EF-P lysine aminoacylase EpmA [Halomonas jeotgali]
MRPPHTESAWQPTADMATLHARARLMTRVRAFFAERNVLEVETPVLGQGGSTDVHLASLSSLAHTAAGRQRLWLRTSPEFHMKRLLAAGSGPIYQLAKSFRDGEVGRRHNIEFTMLEWYRPGMGLAALMEETAALIRKLLPESVLPDGQTPLRCYAYRELFYDQLEIDPFSVPLVRLRRLAEERGSMPEGALDDEPRDTCLDLLMSFVIEPNLGWGDAEQGKAPGEKCQGKLVAVVDYPASQAALARRHVDAYGDEVASRFELYFQGVELANGYDELTDAAEQQARFEADNAERRELGFDEVDVDMRLVAALDHGLPEGSGVALGLDRVIQLALGKYTLAEVMAFATPAC